MKKNSFKFLFTTSNIFLLIFIVYFHGFISNAAVPDSSTQVSIVTSFATGDGTETSPYIISNKNELLYFQQSVNSGTSYENMFITLSSDIYLNDVNDYNLWSDENPPLFIWDGITGFAGTFDGQGHTIYGLYMKSSTDNTGFFNEFNNSTKVVIKNLNFDNTYISGQNNVGAIVGKADYVYIKNCTVTGIVKGSGDYIGGFVGHSGSDGYYGTTIHYSKNKASVYGTNYVGGFIGRSYIGNNVGIGAGKVGGQEKIELTHCTNEGTISATGEHIGGLAGGLIRYMNCGGLEITQSSNYGNVSGNNKVGGIVGYIRSSVGSLGGTTINCSSNSGAITGFSYVGGISGSSEWKDGSKIDYNNIYNAGEIRGGGTGAGGILGNANGGNTLTNAFNYANIYGTTAFGMILGDASGVGCTSIYYLDTDSSANTNNATALSNKEFLDCYKFIGFDFESTWSIGPYYPMLEWQLSYSDVDEYIIQEVKYYTDLGLPCYSYDNIMNADISNREKLNLLNDLFLNCGITDLKEGIEYIFEISSHRRQFLYMTTNENFCAYDYFEWLKSSDGLLARSAMYTSLLIFNNEVYEYTDIMSYVTNDLPGVKKCKNLLLEIIEADMSNVVDDSVKNINEIQTLCKNIVELNNITNTYEYEKLFEQMADVTKTTEELEELENQFARFLYDDLSSYPIVKGETYLYFGAEGMKEVLDLSSKYLKIGVTGAEDIMSIIKLEEDIKKYQNYEKFLRYIATNVDISADMRMAAALLFDDIYDGYKNRISKLLIDGFEIYTDFDDFLETDVVKIISKDKESTAESGTLADAFATIRLSTFLINIATDVGDYSKQVFNLTGYAELSVIYNNKLLTDATAFRKNPTKENAWTFFEDYTILWQLRSLGEKQYTELFKLKILNIPLWKNVFECHLSGYDDAYNVTEENIKILDECRFEIPKEFEILKNVQYMKKAVINCPVDVYVYNSNNELVTVLKDGIESDITNEYGRFLVIYQPGRNEYAKVICQSTDEKLSYELVAVDIGKVDYIAYDANKITSFNNIIVSKDNKIIIYDNTCTIDKNNDGHSDESIPLNISGINDVVSVESIHVEDTDICMYVGDRIILNATVIPQNATYTSLGYHSFDDDIISVKNGVISAITEGETTLIVYSLEDPSIVSKIQIKVLEHSDVLEEDIPLDGVIPNGLWIANLKSEYEYTGKNILPEIRVYQYKTLLDNETDYTITYSSTNNTIENNIVDTGEYTVTITGLDIYEGETSASFIVLPAEPQLFWENDTMYTSYTGDKADICSPTVILLNNEEYNGDYLYYFSLENQEEYTEGLPINAGIYDLKAYIPKTRNYKEKESTNTLTLIINKNPNTPNRPEKKINVPYTTKIVSEILLPVNWQWAENHLNNALPVGESIMAIAEYIGSDKGNYVDEQIEIEIIRSICYHEESDILYTRPNEIPASCEKDGRGHKECIKCGEILEEINIPALLHEGGTATCTQKAICIICKNEYGSTDPNNHKSIIIDGAKEPSCVTNGYTGDQYCKDCSTIVIKGENIDSLDHVYSTEITMEPTTEMEGVRTYTCNVCGYSYTEAIKKLPAVHSHNYTSTITTEPTTEVEGVRTYTCDVCGYSYTEAIEKLPAVHSHNYTSTITMEPTTEVEGVRTYTCDVCGYSYTEAIEKLPVTNAKNNTTNISNDTLNTENSGIEITTLENNNEFDNNIYDLLIIIFVVITTIISGCYFLIIRKKSKSS